MGRNELLADSWGHFNSGFAWYHSTCLHDTAKGPICQAGLGVVEGVPFPGLPGPRHLPVGVTASQDSLLDTFHDDGLRNPVFDRKATLSHHRES